MTRIFCCLLFIWFSLRHLDLTVLSFPFDESSSTAKGVDSLKSPYSALPHDSIPSDEFLDHVHEIINFDGDALKQHWDSVMNYPYEPIDFQQHFQDKHTKFDLSEGHQKSREPSISEPYHEGFQQHSYSQTLELSTASKYTGYSSEEHVAENDIHDDPIEPKRRRIDDPIPFQQHLPGKHEFDLRVGHQRFEEASTSERFLEGSQQHPYSRKLELLSTSEHAGKCFQLAFQLYKQNGYQRRASQYATNFSTLGRKCSFETSLGKTIGCQKIQQNGFPIVLIKKKETTNDYNVRLFHATKKPKNTCELQIAKAPFSQLLAVMDFLQQIFYEGGLDRKILKIEKNLHEELIQWFENIVFHGTEGSPPLLGLATIESLPENIESLFGIPQKYIISILTNEIDADLRSLDLKLVEHAIPLVGYWYKNVAPRKSEDLIISDDILWSSFYSILKEKYQSIFH